MANGWFETITEAQRRAQKSLPKSVYMALVAGSEFGLTLKDNIDAYGELGFAPHVAGLSSKRDLSTTVMGQAIALPVMISPTGVQAVHPDGEVAIARAAAARGTAMGLSSFASKPVEEVVAANPQTFFQLYWSGTRDQILQRVERAKAAGAVGIIVTLDWSFSQGRDWGSPSIPEQLDLRAMARFAPEALVRPRWLVRWARTGRIPDLTVPNMGVPGEKAPTFFGVYGEWMQTPMPTWDDLRWLREQYDGPMMLKGVMRVDDARHAVDVGFNAISVSNHGGNNLDGTPASVRALPTVAEAVGDQVEVLLDGGIRRGSDVVKALALGARAVMIGRAYLWGLAANGQAGVENVLDILRGGIDSGLLGIGKASVHDLTPDDLLIPDGFVRRLGVEQPAAPLMLLRDLTWPEVVHHRGAVLVVPVGSTEQHGPHLPLSTDTDIASAVAAGVAARPDVVVAPALPFGASGEHAGFAGTLSIGQAALELVVVELVRSATDTFARVLLLSGHGGNAEPLSRAVRLLRSEQRDVRAWSPRWRGDAHAGRTETSVQLALDPARVGPDRPAGATADLADLLPELRRGGVRAVSPNGVLGDPAGAGAAEGRELLDRAVAELAGVLDGWPA